MGKLIEDMMNAGVLIATDGLQPSSKGARVRISGGTFTVTDGPFAETKELIAGYAIVEVTSKEEAIEHAKRFLTLVGKGEGEVRRMHDALLTPTPTASTPLAPCDSFARRHLGSNSEEVAGMLATLDHPSLDALIDAAVPAKIRLSEPLKLPVGRGEYETLEELRAIAEIIHDIDLKDNKFGRDEAVGIRTMIDGIALTTPDDLERIARGTEVFNNLYEVFGKKRQ